MKKVISGFTSIVGLLVSSHVFAQTHDIAPASMLLADLGKGAKIALRADFLIPPNKTWFCVQQNRVADCLNLQELKGYCIMFLNEADPALRILKGNEKVLNVGSSHAGVVNFEDKTVDRLECRNFPESPLINSSVNGLQEAFDSATSVSFPLIHLEPIKIGRLPSKAGLPSSAVTNEEKNSLRNVLGADSNKSSTGLGN